MQLSKRHEMNKTKKKPVKKITKKVDENQQSPKYELIDFIDYLNDSRKIKAAQILAYSGYSPKHDKYAQGAITKAAKEAGVNRATIYDWLRQDHFVTAVREAASEITALAVLGLVKMAAKGNPAVCMFLAERTAPHIYSGQFKKFEHEKEMLRLKAELGIEDFSVEPPQITIITQAEASPDYDRNKIE